MAAVTAYRGAKTPAPGENHYMPAQRSTRPVTFYHGGCPGLRPDDPLLPSTLTGLRRTGDVPGQSPYRPHLVYVTTVRDLALMFAMQFSETTGTPGTVYRVQPANRLAPDPDYDGFDPPVSYACLNATVRGIERQGVVHHPSIFKKVARFQFWATGEPMYTPDGYLLPAPQMRAAGMTADHLRPFGRWADPIKATERFFTDFLHPGMTEDEILARLDETDGHELPA